MRLNCRIHSTSRVVSCCVVLRRRLWRRRSVWWKIKLFNLLHKVLFLSVILFLLLLFFYFLFFARASKEETENFTQHQRLCFFHFIGSWNLLTVLILILFSSPFSFSSPPTYRRWVIDRRTSRNFSWTAKLSFPLLIFQGFQNRLSRQSFLPQHHPHRA